MLMMYQYGYNNKKCNEPEVLYKYIPRDFNIDNSYPDNISYYFKNMFDKAQPYIVDYGNINKRVIKKELS